MANVKTDIVSVVTDNGRRGVPIMGCDCVQCFGYCMVDGDEQTRLRSEATFKSDKRKESNAGLYGKA